MRSTAPSPETSLAPSAAGRGVDVAKARYFHAGGTGLAAASARSTATGTCLSDPAAAAGPVELPQKRAVRLPSFDIVLQRTLTCK
jgi:hypothetical protein